MTIPYGIIDYVAWKHIVAHNTNFIHKTQLTKYIEPPYKTTYPMKMENGSSLQWGWEILDRPSHNTRRPNTFHP